MPMTLPNLDDRTFDDLIAEARALIPALAPGWTDHNPSDPGITLVELFAWLTETLIYRLNRVTDDNTRAFLKLLNGPDWQPSADGDLNRDVRDTALALRHTDRAVTPADFESLALAADGRVARVNCVPRLILPESPTVPAPGHVSLVIVPAGNGAMPADLLAKVAAYLEPRRILTTKLHVVPAVPVTISVQLTLALTADARDEVVRTAAATALTRFLDPLTGGEDGTGWPFGRPVYTSEIYRLLDEIPGVDFVTKTGTLDELTTADPSRAVRDPDGGLAGISLLAGELPAAKIAPLALTLIAPKRN